MSNRKKIKYRDIKAGDIFKVPFDSPYFTYARQLTDAALAIYDIKAIEDIRDIDQQIIAWPILFIVCGGLDGILEGKWEKVGNLPLEERLQRNPLFYSKQYYRESLDSPVIEYYRIYDNGTYRHSTPEEIENLEYGFIWNSPQIEERIRNHYKGIKYELPDVYKIKQ
jgi:hypothetical protein